MMFMSLVSKVFTRLKEREMGMIVRKNSRGQDEIVSMSL